MKYDPEKARDYDPQQDEDLRERQFRELQKLYVPSPSGALSSSSCTRYDLIPRCFTTRVADRFALGAKEYPPFNYKKGLTDKVYIIERINHILQHMQAFISPDIDNLTEEWVDDNLAAIAWGVAFLMECETTPKGREIIAEIRTERSVRCQYEEKPSNAGIQGQKETL